MFVKTESCKNSNNDNVSQVSSNLSGEESRAEHGGHRYHAALRLQKVYKSFRARRQLADCAVVAEQRWWKLLDFVELKRSSISFFETQKSNTAVSRWSRARTRAAKVGKGLSKDEKAIKLALQHWLEAIDPRHRYGHNLQFYYAKWLHCDSKEPFFYWLDIGEGRELNVEKCSRSKLQQQCIKYLGPIERDAFEVVITDGKFVYKQSGIVLDTIGGPIDAKWIFVLSSFKTLYVGMKNRGTFQHSSFLAGGATLSAGRLVVDNGVLKAVWPHSGHYLPTEENFQEFLSFLQEHKVDLTNVKQSPSDDEEGISRKNSIIQRNAPENEDLHLHHNEATNSEKSTQGNTDSNEQVSYATAQGADKSMSTLSRGLLPNLSKLEIPVNDDIFEAETLPPSCLPEHLSEPTTEGGYETAGEVLSEDDFLFVKTNLFGEDDDEDDDHKPVPKETIMKRIDSHKRSKSYQLAQQLSSKWSTGAGPRISCMRDYPPELQFRVLEQAYMSPRRRRATASPGTLSRFSPSVFLTPSPTPVGEEIGLSRSSLGPFAIDRKEKSKSLSNFEVKL